MTEEYIVIGNGIAGITAAETLRAQDAQAGITVIADDPFPAYYRPALKDYLAGRVHEDRLWARPASFYQDRHIRFLHEHVSDIQAGQHRVILQSGQQAGYHRLLLACGARASRLSCPGHDLQGVATLRTIADYQAVRQRLASTRRIVVSGSGTLALETIETLRHRGFPVTHLVRRRTLWSEVLDQTASDLVLQQERRNGVEVRLEEEIAEISGKQGQVSGVLTTGGTHIPCELVLIAIGVEPAIDMLQRAGIPCARGLIADEAMRTAAPDIYAAGDVLQTTDAISGRTRVIGQWYPAIQQARAAAYSMLDLLDSRHPFSASAFYNATFLYGLDFASVGLTQMPRGGQGYHTIIADPQPRTYRKIILQGGIPLGMLAVGERRGTLALKRALDHRVDLSAVLERVFADDFQLDDWLDQQGVPPPVLGVRRQETRTARQMASTIIREPQTPGLACLVLDATSVDMLPAGQRRQSVQFSPTSVTIIGRQTGVFLLIDHDSVSRRHAEISSVAGQYMLRDLGSSNGTRVNATTLPPGSTHLLSSGDRLQFGNVTYLFQREHPAAIASATSEQTRLALHATGFYDPLALGQLPASSAQPRLNADGSLLLPGAQEAIAASVVATFQSAPVLIALLQGHPQIFYLKGGRTLTLGRDQENAAVLSDMAASRKHAEIFFGGDGFYLRDLDRANGVKMNAIVIDAPYRLTHGDRILIGSTTLYFLHQAASEAPFGPAPAQRQRGLPTCPTCGVAVPAHARFCAHCAAPLGPVPASI
jgi:NADPH-dependent 2,4-dienoyl-CoA reductase/sulfur reductase-like enzyme/pSer/pThr/pTyr-binding forkhead associated (FHA) protein